MPKPIKPLWSFTETSVVICLFLFIYQMQIEIEREFLQENFMGICICKNIITIRVWNLSYTFPLNNLFQSLANFWTIYDNAFYYVRLKLENRLSFITVNSWRKAWMVPWGSNYNCLRISKNSEKKTVPMTQVTLNSALSTWVLEDNFGKLKIQLLLYRQSIGFDGNANFWLRCPKVSLFYCWALHSVWSSRTT